jgi:hypothetical protein
MMMMAPFCPSYSLYIAADDGPIPRENASSAAAAPLMT